MNSINFDDSEESSLSFDGQDSNNEYYDNPQKRKMYDIQKLQQQNKEIIQMSEKNKTLAQTILGKLSANKEVIKKQSKKNHANISLCGCTLTNPFRDKIIQIVFNPWFEKFILLTIVVNSIVLTIEDPSREKEEEWIEILDYVFLAIFSVEMVLKIIAMGFFMQPYSYMRDAWNILDFLVVILGWFSKFLAQWNISAIRVIRILRPLRTLNNMQGMRVLVMTLLNSLPSMINIMILFIFTLTIFGTIGVQMFKGEFHWRCVQVETRNDTNFDNELYFYNEDGDLVFCNSIQCPDNYDCVNRGNPGTGLHHWDNIGIAFLTQFELITLEGWTDLMYKVRVAKGGQIYYDSFFVISVVFGAFFVLNLLIAVQTNFLNEAFDDIAKQKANEKKRLDKELKENEEARKQAIQNLNEDNSDAEAINNKQIQENQSFFAQMCGCLIRKKRRVTKISMESSKSNSIKDTVASSVTSRKQKEEEEEEYEPICCDCWSKFSKPVLSFVNNQYFTMFIVILIVANTVVLASEYKNQPEWLTLFQYYANIVFTILFAVEMVLMLIGHGFLDYISNGFNIFDGVIVILSLIELGISLAPLEENGESAEGGFVTVLRGFRLLRIFRLVRSWETLQQILATIINSFSAISNLAVLTGLFLFIYALVGKQFFHGEIREENGELSRYNFNGFFNSMITMFIVLTGENWNQIMENIVRAQPENFTFAILYFVSAMLLCNFMLLNLFLAILLKQLQDVVLAEEKARIRAKQKADKQKRQMLLISESKKDAQEIRQLLQSEMGLRKGLNTDNERKSINSGDEFNENKLKDFKPISKNQERRIDRIKPKAGINLGSSATKLAQKGDDSEIMERANPSNMRVSMVGQTQNNNNSAAIKKSVSFKERQSQDEQKLDTKLNKQATRQTDLNRQGTDYGVSMQTKSVKIVQRKKVNSLAIEGKSLYLFSNTNRVRLFFCSIVENSYFESFIFGLIALNCLFLLLDEPVLEGEYNKKTLNFFGDLLSVLFIFECLIKIFVMGFFVGKHSYLRDAYNVLDFLIVVLSIVSWYFEYENINYDMSAVRAFRAVRALRPLKLVSKNEGMKMLVNALLGAIPNLFNVMMVSVLFYLVFGIIGLQLLKGKLGFCMIENEVNKLLDKVPCLEQGGTWELPKNHYDNIFASCKTFFEVSTLETWPDIMFSASDSQELQDLAPKEDARGYLKIIYIVFIFATSFFVMNLFISVIVRQFTDQKTKSEGSAELTDDQREWVKIQRFMVDVKAPVKMVRPTNSFRLKCYNLAKNIYFEYFIQVNILLNTLTMCMDYYPAPDQYLQVLDYCNMFFVIVFTIEAAVLLLGYGPKYYFYVDWNRFDFFIVVLSIFSIHQSQDFNFTAIRIIRVARLLRMIKSSKELQSLLRTLYLAMHNIMNVGLLYMLIIFTFSVAAMALFGDIDQGEAINSQNVNFKTFYISALVLLRASTGENWNSIMHDCDEKGIISSIYWISFQLFSFFIFVNVFIAVIYEEFQNVNQVESTLEVLSLKKRDIRTFLDTWSDFNPEGQHYMKTDKFIDFLNRLPAPLGYKGLHLEHSRLLKIIYCLNIRDHNGFVYFPEVMWAIFYSIIGKNEKNLQECKPMRSIMKKVRSKYVGLGRNTTLDMLCGNKFYRNEMTVTKYLCGKLILDKMRKNHEERNNKKASENVINAEQKRETKESEGFFGSIKLICEAINKKPSSMKLYQYHQLKKRKIQSQEQAENKS